MPNAKTRISILAILMCLMASCGGSGPVDTPRPKAYPRIALADTIYTPIEGLPVTFEVNAETRAVTDSLLPDGSRWITLVYPSYPSAKLYCTFTPVTSAQDLETVVDNRIERMSLNSGGYTSELTEVHSPAGYDGRLLHTPTGTVTPLQFLAHNGRMVVTGALYVDGLDRLTSDSLAPMIDAVSRDMLHTLTCLK